MTEKDKKRFDEIYHSNKYFKNITDMDFIRSAADCEKLFDYMQSEGMDIVEPLDVKKYMQFAYWLGVIDAGKWRKCKYEFAGFPEDW